MHAMPPNVVVPSPFSVRAISVQSGLVSQMPEGQSMGVDGKSHSNALPVSKHVWPMVAVPSSDGTVPARELSLRSNFLLTISPPICDGIVPESPMSFR